MIIFIYGSRLLLYPQPIIRFACIAKIGSEGIEPVKKQGFAKSAAD